MYVYNFSLQKMKTNVSGTGDLNVCKTSWNRQIMKVFWSTMFNPVSKNCISIEGWGSSSRTTTQTHVKKIPGMVEDCSRVASNEYRSESHQKPMVRSENSRCWKAPLKLWRIGVVCSWSVGQIASERCNKLLGAKKLTATKSLFLE